ncbi:gliding motility-associated C-terminal domain-containing protein [Membranicola marinus]|uniref:Gliding motility-associated C-terminal domain-containing protein n=1 Tax=Membranihabitans marinus TaxID=1227546 RepID=A0A953LAG0_9BACT|nr:gliding motility-associated C-terminal domain-containing protein [Membranihabitans marinus]MBY5957536.1 gliding motility-associated C-terminal domain-containing protein [Membranihabitans marinus]
MMSITLLSDLKSESKSYIASPLYIPLIKDQAYYVRYFISPKKYNRQLPNIVADAAGMYLTPEKVQLDIITTLPFTAQIERKGTFFEDYDRWYKVQGKYIARGGEKYAIIGNFRSDEESNYKYTKPGPLAVPNLAYVFIDDILIEAFDPLPDTMLFCASQTTVLNAGFHDATYQWNTGDRDSTISVSRSGKYTVQATIDTLVFEDSTVVIYMDDFSNHTTIDTFFCTDSELILGSPAPGRVQWSHGGNSPVIPIREPGTYQLSVENTCGTYQFTYQVSEKVCDCELDLPNAFSPNGDNRNDIFTIIDQCRFRKWSLGSFQVYDQWGGMVYQELGQSVQWDGQSSDGEELPPGVYTFRLTATTQKRNEEETIQKVGTVYLLR